MNETWLTLTVIALAIATLATCALCSRRSDNDQ